MRFRGGGLWRFVVVLLVSGALPAAASAATVANGDFESGNLSGWHVQRQTEAGDWFAYRGTEAPYGGSGERAGAEPVQAPPQGRFAAIADEVNPDSVILWQDVALEPNASHLLALTAYYQSDLPLATPSPNSLSVLEEAIGNQANEQFRIDVIEPTAPLDTLDPNDILATLLDVGSGAAQKMKPTRLTADLSAFAGQTVRIRAAVTARPDPERAQSGSVKGIVNAGIDAVSIASAGAGVAPPSGSAKPGGKNSGRGGAIAKLTFARARANRRNGTVVLPVKVPAGGRLLATGAKKHPRLVLPASKRVAGATTANLLLRPTRRALRILARKHKLRARIAVRFNPDKGATETNTVPVVFKLAPRPRH
jgi:hypothetical protein